MRIDKFLKNSRIIKRRTVAKEACDLGRVQINGKVAKAKDEVKVDDIIEVTFGNRVEKVRVLDVKEIVGKNDATSLYETFE
ncbi:RNA-binding S4 domain-containing protein [Peptoniphilus stercorisuis]|uniref:RQC P-site tRNA stabilizing factor n=1 Tax=Peptoniphilus stercorisuis TaxID=1436965 RepID=A0ABS4KFC5_9FIRM|nr:RNA-binding S4 domain-containing protein [Peptoniphilus stercorisuis]MBP2025956.1 ribosomal 50S subunit-recycling heat shock protein [Peptoniphilus stercorisuis]